MPIDIETAGMWPVWQHVFKELLTNGAIDSNDFPEFVREQNGIRKNRLNEVLRTLAKPSSHRNRMKYGFTEQRDGVFYGAIVRIGRSQYIWDKEVRIGGGRHDILYTDDEVIRQYNTRQWRFRSLHPKALVDIPELGEVPPPTEEDETDGYMDLVNPIPANIASIHPLDPPEPPAKTEATYVPNVPSLAGYDVLSIDGDRIVVQGGGKLLIATITDRFGVGRMGA